MSHINYNKGTTAAPKTTSVLRNENTSQLAENTVDRGESLTYGSRWRLFPLTQKHLQHFFRSLGSLGNIPPKWRLQQNRREMLECSTLRAHPEKTPVHMHTVAPRERKMRTDKQMRFLQHTFTQGDTSNSQDNTPD